MLNCINKIFSESKTYMFSSNTNFTCKWKHTAFVFLWLIFAKWNTLQAHLYCFIWQNIILFYGWVVFVYIPHLLYPLMCDVHLGCFSILAIARKYVHFLGQSELPVWNITELRFCSPCKLFLPHIIDYLDATQRGDGGDMTEKWVPWDLGQVSQRQQGLWGNGGLHEHTPLGESAF